MAQARCHHGDAAPRGKHGKCLICRAENHRETCRRIYHQNIEAARAQKRASVARCRAKAKTILLGYTTREAAELLRMEMRDVLARAPELARIYGVPDLAPVRTEGGFRWPRAAVDNVRAVMFGNARNNPTSYLRRVN